MTEGHHVVCPHCDQVNRIPPGRPMKQATCGRCHKPLFDGHPVSLDGERFRRHAERNDIPLVADFWAPWCGPCRIMAPAFEQVAADLEPAARFVKVNVDENQDLAAQLGVQGIPALFVLHGGKVLARQAGAMPAPQLRDWVRRSVGT